MWHSAKALGKNPSHFKTRKEERRKKNHCMRNQCTHLVKILKIKIKYQIHEI